MGELIEWFLGHAKSSYWVRDPEYKAAEYIRVMKLLTFLDYSTLESAGKSIEGKLAGLEIENKGLRDELKSLQESNKTEDLKQQLAELSKKLYEAGILKKD